MRLTTTGLVSVLCWSARTASANTAHILTYDPQSQPRHESSSLSPVPARLLLAQRAGVEEYHRADISRDEVIDAINNYGVRWPVFSAARSKRAVILAEGSTGKELDALVSDYTSVEVSPAPAAHASRGLFIDLVKQADRSHASSSDEAIIAAVRESKYVTTGGDMFYAADSLADAIVMFRKLAKSNEWSITALVSPPADVSMKAEKEERFQWGTYEIPQREQQFKAKRDRMPKEAPLAETNKSKPVQSLSAPVLSFATNNTTPLRGILPACFTTQSACETATRNCTGHGQCSKKYHDPDSLAPGGSTGLDCWSCHCKSTKSNDGKKTTVWGGPACQKKDVSVEFWLIALFTVGLISLIGFAIGNLFEMGSQELPSVIGAGVSGPTARK